MAISSDRWKEISHSRFPWERDALDFIRQRLPDCDPYRAWSNFEFIALDGSVNEVDLLVFTPYGLFLIEIKSTPGRLFGDAGTWIWSAEGDYVWQWSGHDDVPVTVKFREDSSSPTFGGSSMPIYVFVFSGIAVFIILAGLIIYRRRKKRASTH